jgi:hypothetical protein
MSDLSDSGQNAQFGSAVLGASVLMFALSSFLLVVRHTRVKSPILHWYSSGLGVIAVRLFAVFFQRAVGSPIGWVGRTAQYMGGLYFIIAVLAGRSEVHG